MSVVSVFSHHKGALLSTRGVIREHRYLFNKTKELPWIYLPLHFYSVDWVLGIAGSPITL